MKKRSKKLSLICGAGGGTALAKLMNVIASAAKQSIFAATVCKDGLLRCARNDGYGSLFKWIGIGCLLLLAGCHHNLSSQDVSVRGLVPPLAFTMQNVTASHPVTAADFQGQVVLLYFGYTNCPDVCPATLYNVDKILRRLGPAASRIKLLFVTVDPTRDTPDALSQYTALFGPDIIGLRGSADQLYRLARRYRVVFSVTQTPVYAVTHSAAVYVFDRRGQAQFLIAGLDTNAPDIAGISDDIANVAK